MENQNENTGRHYLTAQETAEMLQPESPTRLIFPTVDMENLQPHQIHYPTHAELLEKRVEKLEAHIAELTGFMESAVLRDLRENGGAMCKVANRMGVSQDLVRKVFAKYGISEEGKEG
jgi:transcriptional regulator of aromatic amino acid metabolism